MDVVGAGPAGLFAAETLAQAGLRVRLLDRMPNPGRKFLLAGRGGLNLTHTEPLDAFVQRYGPAADWIGPMVRAFPPDALRDWAEDLGQETFVGSSGRVFPRAMKASPLLRAWLERLARLGVERVHGVRFLGFDPSGRPVLRDGGARAFSTDARAFVFALGGASWPRLGSDGAWTEAFARAGVPIAPLVPANCGLVMPFSAALVDRFAGAPVKPVTVRVGEVASRGEMVITRTGLEGQAIYPVVPALRQADGPGQIIVDLRPGLGVDALAAALRRPAASESLSNRLRKAGLSPAAAMLAREAASGPLPVDPDALARLIKAAPLPVAGLAPLDRAISAAGGMMRVGLDERLMVRALPGVFAAGEMLDFDAATGGYLLQACFASARWAALGALDWLSGQPAADTAP